MSCYYQCLNLLFDKKTNEKKPFIEGEFEDIDDDHDRKI